MSKLSAEERVAVARTIAKNLPIKVLNGSDPDAASGLEVCIDIFNDPDSEDDDVWEALYDIADIIFGEEDNDG